MRTRPRKASEVTVAVAPSVETTVGMPQDRTASLGVESVRSKGVDVTSQPCLLSRSLLQ